MSYILVHVWGWLIAAFLVGAVFGAWLVLYLTRRKPSESSPARTDKPQPLSNPPQQPDDLKKIKGVGPAIEKALHGIGIYQFKQVADLSPSNIAWIDENLDFPGRVRRDDWVGQARQLARQAP